MPTPQYGYANLSPWQYQQFDRQSLRFTNVPIQYGHKEPDTKGDADNSKTQEGDATTTDVVPPAENGAEATSSETPAPDAADTANTESG